MKTTPNFSIESNSGPYGWLLLGILQHAVDSINAIRDRRQSVRPLLPETFNRMLEVAYKSDMWLFGQNARLTFRDVCMFHDLDEDQMRALIYSQWDKSFIDWMRDAYERMANARRGKPGPQLKLVR